MTAILLLLMCFFYEGVAQQPTVAVRQYFIAAVEIGWDYIYLDDVDLAPDQRKKSKDIPQKYIKAVYREYMDTTYTVPKPRPAWTGMQGPVIVAQAGDRVVVHFKNLASQPYSISPVGITYWKQAEGAGYDDSTAGEEKEDDAVFPGGYYEYIWDISPTDGPTTSDPECLTYSYSSQVDTVRDVNSGLIGALLICKSSAFKDDGQRRNPAFVLIFAVFDETKSWYGEVGERKTRENFKKSINRKEYHTINGYVNSTLPGLNICKSNQHVIWHLIGMGTAPEIHSIRFQSHYLEVLSHRKASMEMTPMTFITAEMRAATSGRFLISCQIHAHHHYGMNTMFMVVECPESVALSGPDLRNAKHSDNGDYSEEYSNENHEDLFNTISYQKPQVQARASRRDQRKVWEHYIAIEEVSWDYVPHLKHTDSVLQSGYLPAAPHHLDYKYKKVVYVEYTDGSFSHRKTPAKTLLGPLLKGKVNDKIHITLRNLASRPFNIYPNGLTKISPLQGSPNAKDLHSIGVPPNSTFGYIWSLTTDDGPLDGDPQCLIQLYQSTVSPERDLASGLVGTLLICKNNAIDTRGHLFGPDKEWSLVFAVFNENRSWYINENMQKSKPNPRNTRDPELYNSNIIHSVNGFMFSGRQFVICKTEVVFWYVACVSSQSDFLSVYFTGNLFQYQDLYQSVLTLFPMTGVTVSMEPDVMGEWEISAFDGRLKSLGMTIHYTVRPCDSGELPLVDHDIDEDDISDYIDRIEQQPRGKRPQNRTVLVRVCKKPPTNNTTQPANVYSQKSAGTEAERQSECQLKKFTITSKEEQPTTDLEEKIPQDILEEIESAMESTVSYNGTVQEGRTVVRQRRQAEGNGKDVDISFGASEDGITGIESGKKTMKNSTDTGAELKVGEISTIPGENNKLKGELEENKIFLNSSHQDSTAELVSSEEMDQNNIQSELKQLIADMEYLNTTDNKSITEIGVSLDYDDYNQEVNSTSDIFTTDYMDLRSIGVRYRHYYIAAEEITWDYGIRKPHQLIKPRDMHRGMRKFLPEYKKVVFRAYKDEDFQDPLGRGELQEHLGIMGPFIRTEINDLLTVIFKNKASRPYSFHIHGVYDRSQGAGIAQTQASSAPPGVPGEPVAPGEARTYNWRITRTQGPTDTEFDCKTGAYYSTVDKVYSWNSFQPPCKVHTENGWMIVTLRIYFGGMYKIKLAITEDRDLHSGLIGPLLICKSGTFQTEKDIQEYALLFHTFNETKSWYLEENLQRHCTPPCQVNIDDPWYQISNNFAAINGYVAESLPGVLVAQHQQVRWHLLNVGSDGEYHAVHFHGLPFTLHSKQEHRMGVYNLYPGVFGTVEMRPSIVGTWLVECTIGDYQQAGMRAKLLVYNPRLSTADNLFKALVKYRLIEFELSDNLSRSLTDPDLTFSCGKATKKVFENKVNMILTADKPISRNINTKCTSALGMKSGRIENSQITASDHIDNWKPHLARLDRSGYINAWMGRNKKSWIQVDLQRPTLLHGVQTQGVRAKLRDNYITFFTISYSLDQETWKTYRGSSTSKTKVFYGNMDSSKVQQNRFTPPFVGRYVRIHPVDFKQKPALRLELLGCDLNSCSLPLGLQKCLIPDSSFSASSSYSSLLRSWNPGLARLHQEGSVNAWRPKTSNPYEWLQVDLGRVKRITGVLTQGARSLLTQMMVTEFSVTVSHDGHSWSSVFEENSQRQQIFIGNDDSDEEGLTIFDPPLFGRYIRIHPRGWINDIALRLEVLGCDTQQRF